MHQITSGEIHKKNTKKYICKFDLKDFYKKNKNLYLNIKNHNVFYNNLYFSKNEGINFLSINNLDKKNESHFKAIIKKEFQDCEKLFPYLGNIFLKYFFKEKIKLSKKNYLIDKFILFDLLKEEKNKTIKNIVKTYIENCNLEYNISIEKNYISNIALEKNNDMIFKNNFDLDFYNSNKKYEYKNYELCIIDGYIQSVGEINYILQRSNELKIPFFIFCFGMSGDVKNTIITNNNNKKTQVYPISFEYIEENLNILNDIAVIHKADVISSLKGQTISSSISKEITVGKKIFIDSKNKYFSIEPMANDIVIKNHINMLKSKLENKKLSDISIQNTVNRIKSLNSKNFKIFLSEDHLKDNNFIIRIHFYFSLLSKMNLIQKKITINDEKYLIPNDYIDYAKYKAESLLNIFKNIDYIIEEV